MKERDMRSMYWPDDYVAKRMAARDAIRMIKSGQRVFIGSACGEPRHLVKALVDDALRFSDIEIVRLMSMESSPISIVANKTGGHNFNIRCIYQGSTRSKGVVRNKRFMTPMNLSDAPRLFRTRQLPINVALVQVSPPDDFGWMSLGISVDITRAAAQSADLVIAQVNSMMPRVHGRSIIHVNEVDVLVEKDEELMTITDDVPKLSAYSVAIPQIARLAANLIEDGSTFQFDLGIDQQAIVKALAEKNDLGIHTQYLTNGLIDLIARGVVTNRYKGINDGKSIASSAVGTQELYDFIDNNPSVEFHSSEYVNSQSIISRNNQMVSVNVAHAVDLMGQAAADAMPQNHYSGVTGMVDFVRGASQSRGGKSILLIASSNTDGTKSRIVPLLESGDVVIPKGDASYVISEFGAVNLFGKTLQERAMAMISLAHPNFRDELLERAKEIGLVGKDRKLKDFLFGVYPVHMEEIIDIEGTQVTFRPVKPVDDRRIQEHFYNMDDEDVTSRFFYHKKSFFRDDVETMFQIDYKYSMTIVAIVGEFGFGRIIGVGEYSMDPKGKYAEVAFSVHKEWQGKGIAGMLMKKLAEAAKENGIEGLMAFTSHTNHGMISLFRQLPYKIKARTEEDMYVLSCDFSEPADD